ncbi:hypothetical protein GCM10011390_20060 [Aureimonas endophytica]|uniref:O-antigen ligase-related domain-containing protein n=1 Tax=Aureimonas endophytica TaxID=2027858 RepID=A0A917E4X3_9HYPH|nr:O-antigen ligase family protein [Aureimonas endophytica]GGE01178.1 hypothetical protein GCM10011390_20060 [Aureimonas endophytica]
MEKIIVLLIITFPVMGVFFAPESYFAPQGYSIANVSGKELGFPFGRIAFIILLIWLVPQYLRMPRTMGMALLRSGLPVLFVCLMVVSGTWTADPGQSINRSFRTLLLVLMAVYLIERYDWRELYRFFAIAGVIAIVGSTFAALAMPTYGLSDLEGYRDAWRGALQHKNSLGALMTLLLPIAYLGWRDGALKRPMALFLLFGSAVLVVKSRSATSIVTYAATAGLLVAIPFFNRLHSRSVKLGVAFLAVALAYPLMQMKVLLDDFLGAIGRSTDFTGRQPIWDIVNAMSDLRPVWGYGSGFWAIDSLDRDYIWSVMNWAVPHAHNTFLDIRFQLGYVGLAIAVLFFGIAALRMIRGFAYGMPTLALLWPLIIITTFIRGSTETYIVEPGSGGLFWFVLSYAALGKLAANAPQTGTVPVTGLGRWTGSPKVPKRFGRTMPEGPLQPRQA